ncbi:hypothetical protein BH11PSE11_BH11PSE11_33190 [soil metagenome]
MKLFQRYGQEGGEMASEQRKMGRRRDDSRIFRRDMPLDLTSEDSDRRLIELSQRYAHIPGWGADLAHENRPAYPMERMPSRLENAPRHVIEHQPRDIEILHSTERPGVTPIFGTSTPPTGLSGMIRRFAYKLSENDIRHWLLLLFADRVNVVEGIGQDLARGHVPNIFSEMGARAELKHNPARFARKVAVAGAILGAGYYLMRRRKMNRLD